MGIIVFVVVALEADDRFTAQRTGWFTGLAAREILYEHRL
jgi:hypothetical protein